MTRWYRAYENTVTDPKLGEAALIADCSRSIAIAGWHALLENACHINDEGRLDTTARRVAIILGEPPELVTRLLDAFSELGMTTSGAITAWSRRQYKSDTSTERVREHRSRKRNGDETLQKRQVTAPEADTDTETESSGATAPGAAAPSSTPASAPPSAHDLKAAVFASGVPLLTSTGTSDRGARSMLGRWRQQHGDGAVLDALSAAHTEAASSPIPFINRVLETRNAARRGGERRRDGGFRDPLLERELAVGGGHARVD